MFIFCYNINSVCSNKNIIEKEFNLLNMYFFFVVEVDNKCGIVGIVRYFFRVSKL